MSRLSGTMLKLMPLFDITLSIGSSRAGQREDLLDVRIKTVRTVQADKLSAAVRLIRLAGS